jgi:hypothetical protein
MFILNSLGKRCKSIFFTASINIPEITRSFNFQSRLAPADNTFFSKRSKQEKLLLLEKEVTKKTLSL